MIRPPASENVAEPCRRARTGLGERRLRAADGLARGIAHPAADREEVSRGLAAPWRVVDEPGPRVALELDQLERSGGLGARGADQRRRARRPWR